MFLEGLFFAHFYFAPDFIFEFLVFQSIEQLVRFQSLKRHPRNGFIFVEKRSYVDFSETINNKFNGIHFETIGSHIKRVYGFYIMFIA